MEEPKFYNIEEIMKFLSLDWEFQREGTKEYPFNRKLEDLKFMWGYIVIPRYGIEKIVQNKISDKEYRDILRKITMLINIPFSCEGKVGAITKNVSLGFEYGKEYKYGEITKSIEEVCYAIIRNARVTNDFYIIDDTFFHEFMSYFVIPNQWGQGQLKVMSAPEVKFNNNFKEIREDGW